MKVPLIILALLAAPVTGYANKENTFTLTYEVFALPQTEAASLKRQNLGGKETYARLIRGIGKGHVTQVKWMTLRAKEGRSAITEEIEEYIFPSEYEYDKFSLPPHQGNGAGLESPFPFKPSPLPLPYTFSAFDTKNTGDTLEFELQVGKHGVDLRLNATHVSHVGVDTYGTGVSEWPMPRFSVQRLRSSSTVTFGLPTLLGTLSPPRKLNLEGIEEKTVWFSFVTIEASKSS